MHTHTAQRRATCCLPERVSPLDPRNHLALVLQQLPHCLGGLCRPFACFVGSLFGTLCDRVQGILHIIGHLHCRALQNIAGVLVLVARCIEEGVGLLICSRQHAVSTPGFWLHLHPVRLHCMRLCRALDFDISCLPQRDDLWLVLRLPRPLRRAALLRRPHRLVSRRHQRHARNVHTPVVKVRRVIGDVRRPRDVQRPGSLMAQTWV
mmetsp:Transcript_63947/g.162084  ORF Transcript_63947/g.162084 Transcript_63947/m.162084 type:complete len:207 (+) Transcript_63947:568-1188(+)